MTKTKSAKRALLMSALSLLMCVSMLIGSTFAWFTDSVTSGRNKIVAGNLDVVLEYKTPESDDWAEVASDTVLFGEDSLWEPGHTEVVALRIRNAGTLALKYDLATTVYEEVAGTNVAGKAFKLSDYLEVGYSAIQQDGVIGDIFMSLLLGNRDNAVSLANSEFGKSVENPNPMILPGESHVCALAITMPTTVGNEANYKTGTEAPYISFGVTVLATQATEEYDSFDNQYDKDADYVAQFTEGTHELNTTLKATKPGDTVSATGTGTVVNIRGGSYDAGSIYNNCAVWSHAGATINIYDGVFIADGDTAEQNSDHHYDLIYAGSSKDTEQSYVNIYGGMFSVRNNGWLLNEADGKGNITVYGGTFVNWNPADNESEGANTNFLADGYTVTKETKANGDVWYTVVKGAYVKDVESLKTALSNAQDGDIVTLGANVSDIGNLTVKAGVTLDGQGYTISGNSALTMASTGEVTVKNANFKNIKNGSKLSAIYCNPNDSELKTITGCTFEDIEWDAIQVTGTKDGQHVKLAITDNVFSDYAYRYIHVEPVKNENVTVDLTITGNKMYTGEDIGCNIGIFCVKFEGSTFNISNNYASDLTSFYGHNNDWDSSISAWKMFSNFATDDTLTKTFVPYVLVSGEGATSSTHKQALEFYRTEAEAKAAIGDRPLQVVSLNY